MNRRLKLACGQDRGRITIDRMAVEAGSCFPPALYCFGMIALIVGPVRFRMKERAPKIREGLSGTVTPAAIKGRACCSRSGPLRGGIGLLAVLRLRFTLMGDIDYRQKEQKEQHD
jgi:hypothetical protein